MTMLDAERRSAADLAQIEAALVTMGVVTRAGERAEQGDVNFHGDHQPFPYVSSTPRTARSASTAGWRPSRWVPWRVLPEPPRWPVNDGDQHGHLGDGPELHHPWGLTRGRRSRFGSSQTRWGEVSKGR